MKTIYLQRQGSGETLNTNNWQNKNLEFYIEIGRHVGKSQTERRKFYYYEIEFKNEEKSLRGEFPSKEQCLHEVERITGYRVSDTIEHYSYGNKYTEFKDWKEICKNDKFFSCLFIKDNTTVVLMPENTIICKFPENSEGIDKLDYVWGKELSLILDAFKAYKKERNFSCNKGKSEEYFRKWFCWYLSESLKEFSPNRKLYIINDYDEEITDETPSNKK